MNLNIKANGMDVASKGFLCVLGVERTSPKKGIYHYTNGISIEYSSVSPTPEEELKRYIAKKKTRIKSTERFGKFSNNDNSATICKLNADLKNIETAVFVSDEVIEQSVTTVVPMFFGIAELNIAPSDKKLFISPCSMQGRYMIDREMWAEGKEAQLVNTINATNSLAVNRTSAEEMEMWRHANSDYETDDVITVWCEHGELSQAINNAYAGKRTYFSLGNNLDCFKTNEKFCVTYIDYMKEICPEGFNMEQLRNLVALGSIDAPTGEPVPVVSNPCFLDEEIDYNENDNLLDEEGNPVKEGTNVGMLIGGLGILGLAALVMLRKN